MLKLPADPTDSDLKADRAAKHRVRSRDGRRRLVLRAGIVTVALVGGALAVVANNHPADPASTAASLHDVPSVPDGEFDMIGFDANLHIPGILAAAGNAQQLSEIWKQYAMSQPLPTVDFSRLVIVAMTIADDACSPTLTGFDEQRRHEFTPVFVEPETQTVCPSLLEPKTFVVGIKRTTVGSTFTLRLPGKYAMQAGEQRLVVDVGTDAVTAVLASEPPVVPGTLPAPTS
ncbi:MAG: hypothetical protein ABI706_13500 [Ilumatobacteraceae bacterium]